MPIVALLSAPPVTGIGDTSLSPPQSVRVQNHTMVTVRVTPSDDLRIVRVYQYVSGGWARMQGGRVVVGNGSGLAPVSRQLPLSSRAGAVCAVSESGTGTVQVALEPSYGPVEGDDPYTPADNDQWDWAGIVPETQAEALDLMAVKITELALGGGTDLTGVALLNGRAGGQVLCGGTGASQQLTLKGTSNAQAGEVVCDNPFRAPSVISPDITAGDLQLKSPPGRPAAHWAVVERPNHIEFRNVLTGAVYLYPGILRRCWSRLWSWLCYHFPFRL